MLGRGGGLFKLRHPRPSRLLALVIFKRHLVQSRWSRSLRLFRAFLFGLYFINDFVHLFLHLLHFIQALFTRRIGRVFLFNDAQEFRFPLGVNWLGSNFLYLRFRNTFWSDGNPSCCLLKICLGLDSLFLKCLNDGHIEFVAYGLPFDDCIKSPPF